MHVDVDYTGPHAVDESAVRSEVERHYDRFGVEARVGKVEYRGKREKRERRLRRDVKYWTPV